MLLLTVTSWLDQREREVLAYLIEENRVLRRQLGGRRLRLTDDDRRKLAARFYRLGRAALREVATIVTPDTLLRWHRHLIARKWTYAQHGTTRRGVVAEIRALIRRMAEESPGYYHHERNHQGLDNELIDGEPAKGRVSIVRRHQRLGRLAELLRPSSVNPSASGSL
jgi:hypothetical protein